VPTVDPQAFGVLPTDAQDKAVAVHGDTIISICQAGNALDLYFSCTFPGRNPALDVAVDNGIKFSQVFWLFRIFVDIGKIVKSLVV